MKNLMIQAFDTVIQRELAEEAEVREEIKRRGSYWAASEIWKLRRQVKALRKQLSERDERSLLKSRHPWQALPPNMLASSWNAHPPAGNCSVEATQSRSAALQAPRRRHRETTVAKALKV